MASSLLFRLLRVRQPQQQLWLWNQQASGKIGALIALGRALVTLVTFDAGAATQCGALDGVCVEVCEQAVGYMVLVVGTQQRATCGCLLLHLYDVITELLESIVCPALRRLSKLPALLSSCILRANLPSIVSNPLLIMRLSSARWAEGRAASLRPGALCVRPSGAGETPDATLCGTKLGSTIDYTHGSSSTASREWETATTCQHEVVLPIVYMHQ